MNINKAIRKQKKSYKRFMLSMCFIFFILPFILFFYKNFDMFYVIYLCIIEILIILALAIRINKEKLNFEYNGYMLKIISGITRGKINIVCDKIAFVHVEEIESNDTDLKDFKIIILATAGFRSKRMIHINENFLKKHSYISYHYTRLKKLNPEKEYFYTIFKKGGLKKYPFLDIIYKSCVYAIFTDETIEKIKFYRENSENHDGKSNK